MKTIFKKNGGFTLVELIVVIAILAILAAVAIPAYSGYIEKANMAADEQLLSAVNTAFASACALNGESHILRDDYPRLVWDEDGKTVVGISTGTQQINDDFEELFESSDPTFQKINPRKLGYSPKTGSFGLGGTTKYANLYASEKSVNDFKYSSYGNGKYMGIDDLLGNVDSIVSWANGKIDFEPSDFDGFDAFYKTLTGTDASSATKDQRMNAFVLYTAQTSEGLNYDTMKGYISGSGETGQLSDAEYVAAKAMKYAVGMAYVREMNVNNPTGWTYVDPTKYNDVLDAIGKEITTEDEDGEVSQTPNTRYEEWFAANGEATMDGYLGAMDAISDNTGNLSESEKKQLLDEGFNSTAGGNDFAALVEGLLGSTDIS